MTQIPAGWYPDPDPNAPGGPNGQRWWDGTQWTEHIQPGAGQGMAGQAVGAPVQYGAAAPATTPDGQPLAGWWQRVGAYVIDVLIVSPIALLLAWPWVRQIGSAYAELIDEALRSAEQGGVVPDQAQLMADIAGPLAVLTVIGIVVNFVYHVSFLKWKAATPGKFVLGLRVRLRETPGALSWGTVLLRWLGQNWYAAMSVVPLLGSLASLYPLLDGLWPLWDSKKQALHDKVAKTNVVRIR